MPQVLEFDHGALYLLGFFFVLHLFFFYTYILFLLFYCRMFVMIAGLESTDAAIFALKQQLQDMTLELTNTKRELRTITMLKTGETDRLRATEARLQV